MADASIEQLRLDSRSLTGGTVDDLCAWIRTLGLDPADYKSGFTLAHTAAGWRLHLAKAQMLPGTDRPVVVANEVVADPVEVDLGPELPDLPWLLELVEAARHDARVIAEVAAQFGLDTDGQPAAAPTRLQLVEAYRRGSRDAIASVIDGLTVVSRLPDLDAMPPAEVVAQCLTAVRTFATTLQEEPRD